MSDEKVIHAFPNRSEIPECSVSIETKPGYCRHEQIRIVEHSRTVECAKCGASLDPFDYIRGEAYALRRGWQDYKSISAMVREKQEAICVLEKERKRLHAQVKRLKDKAPVDSLDMRRPL